MNINKILFLGHYTEGDTGSSRMTQNLILAADSAGINIIPRSVKLNQSPYQIPQRIKELEQQDPTGADACIQCVLPHHLEYNGNYKKNIAYALYECFDNLSSGWGQKLNLMDEVWTCSEYSKACLASMGVTKPIHVVPIPFDTSFFTKSYEKLSSPDLDGNYIFYTIADLAKRKNLSTVIKAFHLAFTPNMPVRLLIKSSRYGMSGQDVANIITNECNEIKSGLKLYGSNEKYLREILITEHLTDEQLGSVHETGDCFVTASHGEAFCMPLFEAMGFANLCIYPELESRQHFDFIEENIGYPVKGSLDAAFGEVHTFFELYTGREQWLQTPVFKLAETMKLVYSERNNNPKQLGLTSLTVDEHSFQTIGQRIKHELCK
jgi:glycosyltransferase involved in cell wall biosynthesis